MILKNRAWFIQTRYKYFLFARTISRGMKNKGLYNRKEQHVFQSFFPFVLALSIPPISSVYTIDNTLEYIYDVTIENASGRTGLKRDRNFCINGLARYSFRKRARKIKRFIFISWECQNDFSIISMRRFQFSFDCANIYFQFTFYIYFNYSCCFEVICEITYL